jgi:GT2 family glycosyltransferase/glycosyltransferase involved in cell wall biosynthesis
VLRLIKRFWQSLPLSDHNRWRITALLLEPILPFIKGGVVHNAYLREKEWQQKRVRPFYGDPFPLLPQQAKPDIIFWSVIDWHLRIQRPQHLARGLAARGYRVFYISTTFVNNTGRAGFELEQLDSEGRLFSIRFHMKGRPRIYFAPSRSDDASRLKENAAALLEWTGSKGIISVVQHPYWYALARALPDSRLIYDCLDHHAGFGTSGKDIAALEIAMLENADAVVATSQWLHDLAATHNRNAVLIRNATEYDFFCSPPASVFRDPGGRRVLGYYGVIAEWMDVELLAAVAKSFPDCLLLLVGADECSARQRLADFTNVLFTGEVKYADLPYYLHGMEVCLLPFRVTPLTLATNPVKIYEYLSAGKPVVAIDLPEMAQFEGLVATANGHDGFLASVSEALAIPVGAGAGARRCFAMRHTWYHRVEGFVGVIDGLPKPLASIVVLTYNNLELTQACLNSIERFTEQGRYEVIVVDNASNDGTRAFLQQWAGTRADRAIVLNDENRGFAAGNNQGLALARGEYLVMLNNDTEVTQGWLPTLMSHLRHDPSLGMVGPVTDNIGNEARIRLSFRNPDEMCSKARVYTLAHMGETIPMRTLAFFCVMLPRQVYEKIGPIDESYGQGFFEDDDYCRRVELAGWRIACAEDVFVHHHLSASFDKLGKGRQELMERNRKVYEAKWGPWIPHKYR